MLGKLIVLQEEESVSIQDAQDLCESLKAAARFACEGNSSSVDRPEWKAARIIQALIHERRNGVAIKPRCNLLGKFHLVESKNDPYCRECGAQL